MLSRSSESEVVEDIPKTASAKRALIMGSLAAFTSGKVARDGYLKPAKRNLPDLVVTEPTLRRAASILLRLATHFRDLNYRVSVSCGEGGYSRKTLGEEEGRLQRSVFETGIWSPGRPTLVFLDEIAIGLTIYEQTADKEMVYLDGKHLPVSEARKLKPGLWNGTRAERYHVFTDRAPSKRLCLRAYSPYYLVEWAQTWTEQKVSLTKQIDEIVRSLISRAKSLAPELAEAKRQADLESEQMEAERAIAQASHQRSLVNKARKDALQNLLSIINKWSDDRKLKDFFEDITSRSATLSDEVRRDLLQKMQEAMTLLASTDSIGELLAWQPPPPKPSE
jgi:hypothetical protein